MDKSGRIKDNASHLLADIRKNKTEAAKRYYEKDAGSYSQRTVTRYCFKEISSDTRNGYFVIPVNASYKKKNKR